MSSKSKDILEKFEKFTNMQNSVDRFERSIGKIRSNRAEASGQNRFGIDKHRGDSLEVCLITDVSH